MINNGTSYQCVNTCDSTCTQVYEASGNIVDGPFASIEFMCEGNDIGQVDALYTFVSGNDGVCTSGSTTVSRKYHVGRLGVLCSTDSSRAYLYDDANVDCLFG